MSNRNVTADAQFQIWSVLRPFTNFEADYEGEPSTTPIMMTPVLAGPGGIVLAEYAGKSGYSPNLVAGLSVPYGARVTIWLPMVPNEDVVYRYGFIWRVKSAAEMVARGRELDFHQATRTGLGVPDTTFSAPQDARVVIPAAYQSVIYNQEEPDIDSSPTAFAVQHSLAELIGVRVAEQAGPLLPGGGAGDVEQGVLDPTNFGVERMPLWQTYDLQALGDELLVTVTRETDGTPNWGFDSGSADHAFALLFGHGGASDTTPVPEIGLYASAGSAP